jgi:hypothetical protein
LIAPFQRISRVKLPGNPLRFLPFSRLKPTTYVISSLSGTRKEGRNWEEGRKEGREGGSVTDSAVWWDKQERGENKLGIGGNLKRLLHRLSLRSGLLPGSPYMQMQSWPFKGLAKNVMDLTEYGVFVQQTHK